MTVLGRIDHDEIDENSSTARLPTFDLGRDESTKRNGTASEKATGLTHVTCTWTTRSKSEHETRNVPSGAVIWVDSTAPATAGPSTAASSRPNNSNSSNPLSNTGALPPNLLLLPNRLAWNLGLCLRATRRGGTADLVPSSRRFETEDDDDVSETSTTSGTEGSLRLPNRVPA
jgi:hypothetical protein